MNIKTAFGGVLITLKTLLSACGPERLNVNITLDYENNNYGKSPIQA